MVCSSSSSCRLEFPFELSDSGSVGLRHTTAESHFRRRVLDETDQKQGLAFASKGLDIDVERRVAGLAAKMTAGRRHPRVLSQRAINCRP